MTERIEDLVDIPTGGLTEELADKYNGTKVKIARIVPDANGNTVQTIKSRWKDNKQLPEGQFVDVKAVVLETDAIGIDEAGKPIVIKQQINLKTHPVTGKLGFSKHEKSTAYKFFKMLKINKVEEAIGRDVVIVKSGDDRLVISIPN